MDAEDQEGPPGRPSEQRRRAERRRLWDRRAPEARRAKERRTRDRRAGLRTSQSERRSGSERRREDRREAERRLILVRRRGRRRRETPTPYTAEEVSDLRGRFSAPGPVSCPACGSRFALGPGRRRGVETARRVMCLGCGRVAVVPNTRVSRILLVGTNAMRRDALWALLASAGHDVIEAADTAVALQAYQVAPADVVFLDVNAPGRLAAPDFLRRLRRQHPDARVVAMAGRTSYVGGADPLALTQGAGAVRTIRMPFSRDDVLRTIEEVRP